MPNVKSFGFDLDNTLIDYTQTAVKFANINSVHGIGNLHDLRNRLKYANKSEDDWTSAQSWIYGVGLEHAQVSDFALELLENLRTNGWDVSVHSHKSLTSPLQYGAVPLRALALDWLSKSNLSLYIDVERGLHFYDDLDSKVDGIRGANLSFYVDDLPAVFQHPNYPREIISYLYKSESTHIHWLKSISNFSEIEVSFENA